MELLLQRDKYNKMLSVILGKQSSNTKHILVSVSDNNTQVNSIA